MTNEPKTMYLYMVTLLGYPGMYVVAECPNEAFQAVLKNLGLPSGILDSIKTVGSSENTDQYSLYKLALGDSIVNRPPASNDLIAENESLMVRLKELERFRDIVEAEVHHRDLETIYENYDLNLRNNCQ